VRRALVIYAAHTDTFASKVSAIQDPYADNAVGNVTGSNAVNVFLGIGIAWTVAAFVHMYRGSVFEVGRVLCRQRSTAGRGRHAGVQRDDFLDRGVRVHLRARAEESAVRRRRARLLID